MKPFDRKCCGIVALLFIICIVCGSLFDYTISSSLFNIKSKFGVLFASYGQLPGMLCISAGGSLLILSASIRKKTGRIIGNVVGGACNLLAVMGITMDPMLYMKNMNVIVSLGIACLIVILLNVGLVKLVKGTPAWKLQRYAGVLLGVVFAQLLLINLIKIPWGRPRMRLLMVNEQASFQSWWVMGSAMKEKLTALGVAAEEFKSFPSGHTGNAACAMLLGTLPYISTRLKGKENILFFAGFVFMLLVAISRIIMGAHFLSDVTMGAVITFICSVVFIKYRLKKGEYNDIS